MFSLLILFVLISNASAQECGKLLSVLLKYDPKEKTAIIKEGHFIDEEYCDGKKKEEGANFDIALFDKYKKPVTKKSVFVTTFTIVEASTSKKEMILGKTKLIQDPQFRVVKFALPKERILPLSYKITSRLDKKIIGEGEIK